MKKVLIIALLIIGCGEQVRPVFDDIEYLDYQKPDGNHPNYVAILLYKGDITEKRLIDIVKIFNQSYEKAVLVKIFSSTQAYQNEKNNVYGNIYDSDYLLFYVKNLRNWGAHKGFNEIRWMQAKGELIHLLGTIYKL